MQEKKVKELFVVFAFSIFMVLAPWASWQGAEFVDLERYRLYFLYGQSIFEYQKFGGLKDYLFSEALWHYSILTLVRDFGVSIDVVFNAISFFCLTIFAYFLVKRKGIYSVILLVNPLIVSLAMSQIRIALAFSVLLIAYMGRKIIWISVLLIVAALFIHTSSLIFVGVFLAIRMIVGTPVLSDNRKWNRFFYLCGVGVFISIAIGPLREIILGYFGDRRASYGDASSSVLYTLFWVCLLLACAFQNRSFFRNNVNCFAVVILSLVSFNLLTGGYSTRFIAVALPMIMSAMLDFRSIDKKLSVLAYIFYCTFQWVYWLQV